MAIGAALNFCSFSLSLPVLVVALTPIHIKTKPPNTIRGAKPLDNFEHRLARSDSCSATKTKYSYQIIDLTKLHLTALHFETTHA